MDEREFSRRTVNCTGRLWRIAYLILRNEADCDDAVQDALLLAWKKRHTLRNDEFFETWLTRILINSTRSMLRRKPFEPLPPEAQLPDNPPPDIGLRDAIRSLDVKLRIPLILHHVEGYSLAECAHLLKLPVSTVKWRIHAACKKLREALEEE